VNSYLFLYRPSYRVYVCVSFGFPKGICFLDNPSSARHPVDTCSTVGEHERGYFVPNFCYCVQRRASLSTGVHSGMRWGCYSGPSPWTRPLLGWANNPRRLPCRDGGWMSSCSYPYWAVLVGVARSDSELTAVGSRFTDWWSVATVGNLLHSRIKRMGIGFHRTHTEVKLSKVCKNLRPQSLGN